MIKNILLDLDDTLLDFGMAEREALKKTLLHFGIAPSDEMITLYSEINKSQWKLLELGELTRAQVRVRRYELLFEMLGIEACAADVADCYESMLCVGHWFVDGAEELLLALSRDYRLYIVSNGYTKTQHARIESAGIGKYFDGIFISQEIGYDKPNVAFFDAVFDRINGLKREQTLIVGDSLTSDIKGGKAAGITTVWFNRSKKQNTTDITPDYEIEHLIQLCPLLKKLT